MFVTSLQGGRDGQNEHWGGGVALAGDPETNTLSDGKELPTPQLRRWVISNGFASLPPTAAPESRESLPGGRCQSGGKAPRAEVEALVRTD